MRIAEAVSKTSTFRTTMQHRNVHIGAVIVKKNRIISAFCLGVPLIVVEIYLTLQSSIF